MWHPARKLTQTLVFALLLAAPSAALTDVVHRARAIYGESLAARRIADMGAVRKAIISGADSLLGDRPRSAPPLTDRLAGSPWALRIGSFRLVDPLNALGALVAGGGAVGTLMVAALPLLLLTAALGRVFCGWLCPIHFLLEMTDGLRSLLKRLGVPVRNFRLRRSTKFAVLGLGTVATAVLGAQVFPLFYPPAVLARQAHEIIFFGAFGGGLVFLGAVAFAEVFLSRRLWCRTLCPGGGLYSLLSVLRWVSIDREAARCDGCGDCDEACAFGLSPMTDRTGIECTSCLECVRACPTDALALRFGRPAVRKGLTIHPAPQMDEEEAA